MLCLRRLRLLSKKRTGVVESNSRSFRHKRSPELSKRYRSNFSAVAKRIACAEFSAQVSSKPSEAQDFAGVGIIFRAEYSRLGGGHRLFWHQGNQTKTFIISGGANQEQLFAF